MIIISINKIINRQKKFCRNAGVVILLSAGAHNYKCSLTFILNRLIVYLPIEEVKLQKMILIIFKIFRYVVLDKAGNILMNVKYAEDS
jgi:hypothetical protein